MLKILLTRNALENNKLLLELPKDIFQCHELNLLEYQDIETQTDYSQYNAIVVTSKYAAQKIQEMGLKNIDFFVVGEISTKILNDNSTVTASTTTLKNEDARVVVTAEDVFKLRRCIMNYVKDKPEYKLLYLSGNHITTNMPDYVDRKIFYNVKYRNYLTEEEINVIKSGIDLIPIYSKNCAKTLLRLIVKYDIMNFLEHTTIIVVSSKVAEVVKGCSKNIVICNKAEEMIERLRTYE